MIGNKDRFGLEIVPVAPDWELCYRPEAAAWAGLAIWIDGRNICSHVEPGATEIRQYLFVPLGPIADWIVRSFPAVAFEERARDFPTGRSLHRDVTRWGQAPASQDFDEDAWFEARESWWSRHFLRAGADGARLPDLAFVRDDEALVLSWTKPNFAGRLPPGMVWPSGESAVSWIDGVEILERFVCVVADAFRLADWAGTYAWISTERPLTGQPVPLETAVEFFTARDLHALEAITRTADPHAALEALGLGADSADPAESPHCQILRDLSSGLSPQVGELVLDTGARALAPDAGRARRWLRGRDVALDAARAGTSPEDAGQLAAKELRRSVGLDAQPVDDLHVLLGEFGLDSVDSAIDGQGDRMMAAAQLDGSPSVVTLRTPRTEPEWGRRFEHARGLGHLLLDPIRGGAVGAASGPYAHAARRRRSGAFAAELLLPTASLAHASGGRLDGVAQGNAFETLLTSFGVGARTAAFQLWNHHWLSSAGVRDELIDRYASRT